MELQALAVGQEKRTRTAQLRDLIEEVEKTLAAGVKRQAVHEVFTQNGLKMTLAAFNSALQRVRKERSITMPPPKYSRGSTYQNSGNDNKKNEDDTQYPNSDPRALDKIFSTTHDLEALAKHAKKLEEREKNAKRKEKK